MTLSNGFRRVILLWLAWAGILIAFQTLVSERYQPNRPDRALEWTPGETARTSQRGRPYLLDPFMNNQVAWDSEYYLSIATVGYDDTDVLSAHTPEGRLPLNYAFFPLYPLMMSVVRVPFTLVTDTPIAASAAAGVLIALLGTLGGMIALYDLAREDLGEDGALRAVFYLLIFPSAFFLAQVYTEGLFIGLAFGSLALLRRQKLLYAALLAALATLTRSVGVLLIVPLAFAWLNAIDWKQFRLTPALIGRGVLVLAPLIAYGLWRLALGHQFTLVEENYFGRALFNLESFSRGVTFAFEQFIAGENRQMRVYYGMEFAAVALAVVTSLFTLRRYPGLSLFGLLAIVISVTSGAPQSLIRYMLPIPAIYLALGRWGRAQVFDRAWTFLSLLVFGMQVSLFTFDMWVA